jgi:glycosyltransferase involved in cell wall biosynthesis
MNYDDILQTVIAIARAAGAVVRDRFPRTRLTRVGFKGAAKLGLMRQAEEMGLANVRFLPFQPHEAVPELYAGSDLCLVPLRRGITRDSVPSKVYTIVAAVDEGSDTWQFVQEVGCGLPVDHVCSLQPSQVERHELVPGVAQGGPPSIAANTAKVGRAESENEVADSVAGQDGG